MRIFLGLGPIINYLYKVTSVTMVIVIAIAEPVWVNSNLVKTQRLWLGVSGPLSLVYTCVKIAMRAKQNVFLTARSCFHASANWPLYVRGYSQLLPVYKDTASGTNYQSRYSYSKRQISRNKTAEINIFMDFWIEIGFFLFFRRRRWFGCVVYWDIDPHLSGRWFHSSIDLWSLKIRRVQSISTGLNFFFFFFF